MVILLEELYDFYEQAEHETSPFARDALRLAAFEARLQLFETARGCPWNFGFRQPLQNPYGFSSISTDFQHFSLHRRSAAGRMQTHDPQITYSHEDRSIRMAKIMISLETSVIFSYE